MTPAFSLPPGMRAHHKMRGPTDLQRLTGCVGEQHIARLLGAVSWTSSAFRVSAQVVAHPDDSRSGYDIVPDLWWPQESAIVEVKSCIGGRKYYVTRRQLMAYRHLRIAAREPIRSPRVYYAFVDMEHPLAEVPEGKARNAKLKRSTAGEILSRLQIRSATLVDLSVVWAWCEKLGSNGRDFRTPLSPLLGLYEEYYRLTPRRISDYLVSYDYSSYAWGGRVSTKTRSGSGLTNSAEVRVRRGPRLYQGELPRAPRMMFETEPETDPARWDEDAPF